MNLIYWGTSENCVPKVDLVEAGKMGKREDLRKFKEGQIVTAGQLVKIAPSLQWSAVLVKLL